MLRAFGMEDTSVSRDTIRRALKESGDDPDIRIDINSYGGVVDETLTMYDILRTSGKNIYTNIIGECHSAAVILLLAAPAENRSANPNARALIHKVYCPVMDVVSADDAMALAKSIKDSEDAILNIYEDRTGQPRDVLESLMDAEQVQTADSLLKYGFITKINTYNTNSFSKNKRNMGKTESRWNKFLANARNALGAVTTFNYDYTDAEGKVLFSTEGGDDEVLEVGEVVKIAEEGKTSGTFELGDGRKVTIEDNIVTEIVEAPAEPSTEEELQNLLQEGVETVQELAAENNRLRNEIADLRNQIRSAGKPKNRISTPAIRQTAGKSIEELKNAAREALAQAKNKK